MITRCGLKAVKRNQQGFTLIEILVATVIAGIIGSAAATLTFQIFNNNSLTTNRQIAISQIENAVHYISRDTQQAQHTVPKDITDAEIPEDLVTKEIPFILINGDKLTLHWITWDNTKNEIIYTVTNGVLQKVTLVNDILTDTMKVAEHISIATGTWNTEKKTLSLQIQATTGNGRTQTQETRTIQIIPRPAQ